MEHMTPADTKEFAGWDQWRQLARAGQLNVIKALAAWTDICGVGQALEQAHSTRRLHRMLFILLPLM
jgi:hypothetical protein